MVLKLWLRSDGGTSSNIQPGPAQPCPIISASGQGLNCTGTVRYCVPALLKKAQDHTGTSTARRSAFPRSRAKKFYFHGSKRKSYEPKDSSSGDLAVILKNL